MFNKVIYEFIKCKNAESNPKPCIVSEDVLYANNDQLKLGVTNNKIIKLFKNNLFETGRKFT